MTAEEIELIDQLIVARIELAGGCDYITLRSASNEIDRLKEQLKGQ